MQKKQSIAGLLCFFFGELGAHRFYIGKWFTGLLYLFTNGFWGIGVIVDMLRLCFGSLTDANAVPLLHDVNPIWLYIGLGLKIIIYAVLFILTVMAVIAQIFLNN